MSWRFFLLRLALVVFCLCAFSLPALSSRAFASTDPITVLSRSSTVSFPKSIDFQVSARDTSAPITRATIYLMYNGRPNIEELYPITPASPARILSFHWHEDTTTNHFSPPGTQVSYYWRFEDSAGDSHTDQTQTFQVTDTRFTWQHLSQGLLQVNWYNRPADFGQMILDQASSDIQRISGKLGGGLHRSVNLWIYANTTDFHSSLSPQTHEWVGGVALPTLNQAAIVVGSPSDDTLIRDMPHELTHLVFHQLVAPGITPVWFDEGLAVYNQQFKEPMMLLSFKDALNAHALLRLKDITLSFPADANQAYLAYAQSWQLVDYMYGTFKQSKMDALIKAMHGPQTDFNQDMIHALGLDVAHLENQWRLSLHQPATLSPDLLTPAMRSTPKVLTTLRTTDSNAPLLLALGVFLILLSLLTSGSVLAYQQRCRRQQRRQLAQQQQAIASSPYQAYSSSPSYYPPSTPPGGRGRQGVGELSPPSFYSGREYLGRYPGKQAPQE